MQPTTLQGIVTPYKGNGRKLGYPTANIAAHTVLKDGVYFGFATMSSYVNQPALIFIGVPTTMGDTERRVEAHVLDIPDEDYYGQALMVQIVYFYRKNQTFESVEKLMQVIKADDATARQWFRAHPFS